MTRPFAYPDDLSPTDDDLIDYATALIRLSCEWHIFPVVSATLSVDIRVARSNRAGFVSDHCGPHRLYLRTLQIVSVASATLPDGTVLAADQLVFDPVGWVGRADGLRWPSTGTVQFAVTHGYADVPPAIKAATVSITKRLPASMSVWTRRKMGTALLEISPRVGIAPGSFNVAEELVLERYRLPVTRA
jgi:hypothetical protein